MKKSTALLFMLLFTSSTILFTSCKKDSTTDAANKQFVGSYSGTLDYNYDGIASHTTTGPATLTISAGAGTGDITMIVTGGGSSTNAISATVGGNAITIPSQDIYFDSRDKKQFSGTGSLSGTALAFSTGYGSSVGKFNFTGTKQ